MLKVLFLTLAALAGSAQAEQVQRFGPYLVHYNAFNSTFLHPSVAGQYGLSRSKYQGVLNIAVRKDNATGGDAAVKANLSGRVRNDIAQSRDLEFRQVEEGEAVYYIANFSHGEHEKLDFDIELQPEGRGERQKLKFSHEFFAD